MNCYNLKVIALLKQNLKNEETYEKISNLISYAMLKDKNLKEMHEKNTYKNYVFCSLYPVQKDGIYKQNNIYSFDLRGLEFSKIMKLKQVLANVENEYFKIIQINLQNRLFHRCKHLIVKQNQWNSSSLLHLHLCRHFLRHLRNLRLACPLDDQLRLLYLLNLPK